MVYECSATHLAEGRIEVSVLAVFIKALFQLFLALKIRVSAVSKNFLAVVVVVVIVVFVVVIRIDTSSDRNKIEDKIINRLFLSKMYFRATV